MSVGFSLFEWVSEHATNIEPSLQTLVAEQVYLRVNAAQGFSASVRGLLYWCRLNERLAVQHHAENARVYAGFERFSRVTPALARYRLLSRAVRQLTIFGCADITLSLSAARVGVSEDHPLAREWFLIVDAPEYTAMLVARELEGSGSQMPRSRRQFSGVALHDAALVRRACDHLDAEAARLTAHTGSIENRTDTLHVGQGIV